MFHVKHIIEVASKKDAFLLIADLRAFLFRAKPPPIFCTNLWTTRPSSGRKTTTLLFFTQFAAQILVNNYAHPSNHTFCSKHYPSLSFALVQLAFYPSLVLAVFFAFCRTDLLTFVLSTNLNLLKVGSFGLPVCNFAKRKPVRCENHAKYNVSRETKHRLTGTGAHPLFFAVLFRTNPPLQQSRPFEPFLAFCPSS